MLSARIHYRYLKKLMLIVVLFQNRFHKHIIGRQSEKKCIRRHADIYRVVPLRRYFVLFSFKRQFYSLSFCLLSAILYASYFSNIFAACLVFGVNFLNILSLVYFYEKNFLLATFSLPLKVPVSDFSRFFLIYE
jgi:hypothetical protein